jgi:cell division protein FtsL
MGRTEKSNLMLNLKSGNDYTVQERKPAAGHVRFWLFTGAILGAVFVVCAIFHVWLYIQQLQNGYRLARICEENELHSTVQRKLRLEWSRFSDPYRLEEIGRNQFGLGPPRPDQKIVLK